MTNDHSVHSTVTLDIREQLFKSFASLIPTTYKQGVVLTGDEVEEAIETAYAKLSPRHQEEIDIMCEDLMARMELVRGKPSGLGIIGARSLLAHLGMWLIEHVPAPRKGEYNNENN